MRKQAAAAFLALLLLLLSGCSQSRAVRLMEDAESKNLGSDLETGFALPGGQSYDIGVTFFHDGESVRLDEKKGIFLKKEDTLFLGGTGESFVEGKWSWKLLLGEESLDVGAPEERVEAPGASYDVGEGEFTMESGKEYLLAYSVGLLTNQMETGNLVPFSKWSSLSESEKNSALAKFSYVYLVTIKLTDEE